MGLEITKTALWLCHSMQFGVMLTVLSNLVQYYFYVGQKRWIILGTCSHRERYGPPVCIAIASILLMVYPTVFLLQDLKLVNGICQRTWFMRAVFCGTYVGFLHLLYGAAWVTRTSSASNAMASRRSDSL